MRARCKTLLGEREDQVHISTFHSLGLRLLREEHRAAGLKRGFSILDPEAARLRRRFTAIRFAAAELGRRASSGPHTDDRLFVSHLIDLVTAILAAPVSSETVRLADERDGARGVATRP